MSLSQNHCIDTFPILEQQRLSTQNKIKTRRAFERVSKLMDNRHDFKPDGRNKSITIQTVLDILSEYYNLLKKNTDIIPYPYKELYNELLQIHCSNQDCTRTALNIDKDVEHVFEAFFHQIDETPSELPTMTWNDFKNNQNLLNHIYVFFKDKKELKNNILPSSTNGDKNVFLDTLNFKLKQLLNVNHSSDINYVIDTCALTEDAFISVVPAKNEEEEAQHNLEIAKNYSRIYIGNGTDLDIFNRALTTKGYTRYDIEYCTDTDMDQEFNHLMFKTFRTVKKDGSIDWHWKSKKQNISGSIVFDRNHKTTRFGVNKFSELIKEALKSRGNDVTLLTEFKNLTKLDPFQLKKIEFARHVFDLKRLMDTSQIMYTWYLENVISKQEGPLHGKKFIFVSIDYMACCIARLMGLSVIHTKYNPKTKERGFVLHVNRVLTYEEIQAIKESQEKKHEKEYTSFREKMKHFNVDFNTLPREITIDEFKFHQKVDKQTIYLEESGEEIFHHLMNLFKFYILRVLHLIASYKNIELKTGESFNESFKQSHRIYLKSDDIQTEYDTFKTLYNMFQQHEEFLFNSNEKNLNNRIQHFLTHFSEKEATIHYFKYTPLIHLLKAFDKRATSLECPIYYTEPTSRIPKTIIYKTHRNATKSQIYGFDKWMRMYESFKHVIYFEWFLPHNTQEGGVVLKRPLSTESDRSSSAKRQKQTEKETYFVPSTPEQEDDYLPMYVDETEEFLIKINDWREKADFIKELVFGLLYKMDERIFHQKDVLNSTIPTVLKQLNEPRRHSMISKPVSKLTYDKSRRVTLGGSKFLNDYIKHLSLLSNP